MLYFQIKRDETLDHVLTTFLLTMFLIIIQHTSQITALYVAESLLITIITIFKIIYTLFC